MSTKRPWTDIATGEEKAALLTTLKTTMHDLGRIPGLIFAPVIAFVSAYYAKIPADRKGHLQKILDEIKSGSGEGVEKLKGRLKDMMHSAKKKWAEKVAAKKPATKKTSTASKSKKPSSTADKLHHAAEEMKEKVAALRKPAKKTKKKSPTTKPKTTKKTPAKKAKK